MGSVYCGPDNVQKWLVDTDVQLADDMQLKDTLQEKRAQLLFILTFSVCRLLNSSNPEVVRLSHAGGEKFAVGRTFSGWICKGLYPWPHISPHPGDKLCTWRHVDCISE